MNAIFSVSYVEEMQLGSIQRAVACKVVVYTMYLVSTELGVEYATPWDN